MIKRVAARLQASVERFTFSLDVKPDTSMSIKAALGNLRVGGSLAQGWRAAAADGGGGNQ